MPRSTRRRIPLWKQALAVACLVYATLVWVLPVFMLPFFNILPFEHERTFLERLPLSVLGSVFVIMVAGIINKGRLPGRAIDGNAIQKVRHWLGISAGLAMFTALGAALSANLLGSLAKVLPDHPFTFQTTLEVVEYSGSRYKSMKLEYKDDKTGELRYLTLSKRLFDHLELCPGNVVALRGKESAVGRYIEAVTILR